MVFEWGKRYSVGIADVDEQHQRFLDTANALYDAMASGKGPSVLAKTLEDLARYSDEHFALEQRYMHECRYPDAVRHAQAHADFRETLVALREKVKTEDPQYSTVRLAAFLRDWVVGHLQTEDKALFDYRASVHPPKP